MTMLPKSTRTKLGLVIDLDTCVGCHACAVNCKEWNTGGHSAPLTDLDAYGKDPNGVWFNRIHTFEVVGDEGDSRTVHFPKSCLHCEEAPCVTVCPTGASYKREEDGIVLVNAEACIGCNGPPQAYRELGQLLERMRQPDKAIEVYRRGLSGTGGPDPVPLPSDIGSPKVNRPMLEEEPDLPPIRGVPPRDAEPSSG